MTATELQEQTQERTAQPWLWNVVLIDDDQHTYEYVIRMLCEVYGYPAERAYKMAEEVDSEGRVVCKTTHRELAELKREQMVSFGRDPLMSTSRGPMTVVLEPAECGGDEDQDQRAGDDRCAGRA